MSTSIKTCFSTSVKKSLLMVLFVSFGFSFAHAVTYTGSAGPPAHKFSLWYRQPAGDEGSYWQSQWLPIGNGYMGAMIRGPVDVEEVQFTHKSMWTGGKKTDGGFQGGNRSDATGCFNSVKNYLWANNVSSARSTGDSCLSGTQSGFGCSQGMGKVNIT